MVSARYNIEETINCCFRTSLFSVCLHHTGLSPGHQYWAHLHFLAQWASWKQKDNYVPERVFPAFGDSLPEHLQPVFILPFLPFCCRCRAGPSVGNVWILLHRLKSLCTEAVHTAWLGTTQSVSNRFESSDVRKKAKYFKPDISTTQLLCLVSLKIINILNPWIYLFIYFFFPTNLLRFSTSTTPPKCTSGCYRGRIHEGSHRVH